MRVNWMLQKKNIKKAHNEDKNEISLGLSNGFFVAQHSSYQRKHSETWKHAYKLYGVPSGIVCKFF